MIELDFMLTRKCNAVCPICFTNSSDNLSTALSVQDIFSYLNTVYTQHAEVEVHFTGGEPCCFPNFYELLFQVDTIGIPYQFVTNATLLDTSKLRNLKNLKSVVFSLYGCEKYHNQFVGVENAFQKIKHSIIEVSALKIATQINITCFDNNIDEIRALLSDSLFLFANKIKLYPLLAKGRARKHRISITENQYSLLVNDINSNYKLRDKAHFHNHLTFTSVGCSNSRSLFIDEHGNIYPCLTLSSASCLCGNIRNTTLTISELIELSRQYRCTESINCSKNLSSMQLNGFLGGK